MRSGGPASAGVDARICCGGFALDIARHVRRVLLQAGMF
jgi:hypothetical protein